MLTALCRGMLIRLWQALRRALRAWWPPSPTPVVPIARGRRRPRLRQRLHGGSAA